MRRRETPKFEGFMDVANIIKREPLHEPFRDISA